ncbi:MAG: helix-hairpin-helix domain-containing protein [Lachnospiraceae bacterium]|nr:helix-hairpin-helix domain-containing protein [Lachnospiraceae bacterium]
MKTIWKKYGKIVAAAVFLTVAGLYYGFVVRREDLVRLGNDGHPIQNVWMESEVSDEVQSAPVTESPTESIKIYVHICGEVNNPGVYELAEGSRIFEAVEAAGGFTEEAAQASLNLAQVISDEEQIVILSQEEAAEKARLEREQAAGIVNLNTASKEQLMTLPGIGESRAEDIIRYRKESGGFQNIEEIMSVPGIKESAYLKIKDSIAV